MYKVNTILAWQAEARARIWCKENSILYRTDAKSRIFYFKYEEDAVLFRLTWA